MKEANLFEQAAECPTSETVAPQAAATATTPKTEELTLLEVMEICSDLCVAPPLCLLEILEESLFLPEISLAPVLSEIMSLKVSRFGKRLSQIH